MCTIRTMIRSAAALVAVATVVLAQGCTAPGPRVAPQQALVPAPSAPTGFYSGAAWDADRTNIMKSGMVGD